MVCIPLGTLPCEVAPEPLGAALFLMALLSAFNVAFVGTSDTRVRITAQVSSLAEVGTDGAATDAALASGGALATGVTSSAGWRHGSSRS